MTVQWTRNARRQLGEIQGYIGADAPERATAFCERLVDAVGQLERHPFLGALLPEDRAYRQLIVEGYRIVYLIGAKTVDVVTIAAPGMIVTPRRLSK